MQEIFKIVKVTVVWYLYIFKFFFISKNKSDDFFRILIIG